MNPAEFGEFPLYGGLDSLAGFPLTAVRRISPEIMSEVPEGGALVQTVSTPEMPEPRVVADFVSLIYGDCDASSTPCPAPLEVQVWRSCNRYLDDYELTPGMPYPHSKVTVRGAEAARFDDRLEVYTGSVTIVIFADADLAMSAAELLEPLNQLARDEGTGADRLPPSDPGADCT